MTREERKDAINFFKKVAEREHGINCKLAIEALEQERSRLAQITQYRNDCEKLMQENEQLKKALEQEPCEDVISREYLFKVLDDFCGHDRTATITLDTLADLVYDIPSVKPQEPKKGHWKVIPCGNNYGEYRPKEYACSECGWKIDLCRGLQQDTGHRLFCEHCGAKMKVGD